MSQYHPESQAANTSTNFWDWKGSANPRGRATSKTRLPRNAAHIVAARTVSAMTSVSRTAAGRLTHRLRTSAVARATAGPRRSLNQDDAPQATRTGTRTRSIRTGFVGLRALMNPRSTPAVRVVNSKLIAYAAIRRSKLAARRRGHESFAQRSQGTAIAGAG